jgi:hypothetical protein
MIEISREREIERERKRERERERERERNEGRGGKEVTRGSKCLLGISRRSAK